MFGIADLQNSGEESIWGQDGRFQVQLEAWKRLHNRTGWRQMVYRKRQGMNDIQISRISMVIWYGDDEILTTTILIVK